MKKHVCYLIIGLTLVSPLAFAKKKTNPSSAQATPIPGTNAKLAALQYRLNNMSPDDKRLFDALTDDQQRDIKAGKVSKGFNEWMVKLSWGEPFYATEHHPIYVDYEQVWLYTKIEKSNDVSEEKIIDPTNNWPTIHRKTKTKSCTLGDTFVLWDRGVVDDIKPANDRQIYGKCTIETSEAFLPIVNGVPVEPK
ncbi:hypothetical protein K1X76_04585 [bacterium]|nr:hypothetical protein [bacterium]